MFCFYDYALSVNGTVPEAVFRFDDEGARRLSPAASWTVQPIGLAAFVLIDDADLFDIVEEMTGADRLRYRITDGPHEGEIREIHFPYSVATLTREFVDRVRDVREKVPSSDVDE